MKHETRFNHERNSAKKTFCLSARWSLVLRQQRQEKVLRPICSDFAIAAGRLACRAYCPPPAGRAPNRPFPLALARHRPRTDPRLISLMAQLPPASPTMNCTHLNTPCPVSGALNPRRSARRSANGKRGTGPASLRAVPRALLTTLSQVECGVRPSAGAATFEIGAAQDQIGRLLVFWRLLRPRTGALRQLRNSGSLCVWPLSRLKTVFKNRAVLMILPTPTCPGRCQSPSLDEAFAMCAPGNSKPAREASGLALTISSRVGGKAGSDEKNRVSAGTRHSIHCKILSRRRYSSMKANPTTGLAMIKQRTNNLNV